MKQPSLNSSTTQTVAISRCDRWQAYQRLQELGIPCWCLENGHLQVEINSVAAALQLRSVVQQLTASRQALVDWLEHCWWLRV